jgi:RimJ/RimL family protein N-acetyltransferase
MSELDHIQSDLNTARLLLRRMRMTDANFVRTHASDMQVARNLAVVPHPYPEGAAEEFIQRSLAADSAELVWVIEYGGDGHSIPVGVVSLKREQPLHGVLGYWVAPWLWGFGFATEAVVGVVEHARHTGFVNLKASVHEGNAASARVLQKAGFGKTGEGEEYSVAQKEDVHVHYFELVLVGTGL